MNATNITTLVREVNEHAKKDHFTDVWVRTRSGATFFVKNCFSEPHRLVVNTETGWVVIASTDIEAYGIAELPPNVIYTVQGDN